MKKVHPVFVALLLSMISAPLPAAQTSTSQPTPQASGNAAPSSSHNGPGDDSERPFKPYYENELELGSTNQQGGQSTGFFSYTGTFHLDEAGNFLGLGVQTSRQKLEKTAANTASLVLEGGLGLDVFNPALTLNLGGGEQDWRQSSGNLSLGFQWTQDFSTDLTLGGSAGSHSGPASELASPLTGSALIDVTGANSSLGLTFIPWDWWSISATFEFESDGTNITYQGVKYALNQSDQISTFTLGLDFTLFKGFVLDLSPQIGQIYYPAGLSYSIEAGGLVYNATANTQNIAGLTSSISYSFQ